MEFHVNPIEAIPFDDYLRDFVEELRFDLEKMKVEIDLIIENNRDYVINGDRFLYVKEERQRIGWKRIEKAGEQVEKNPDY